MNLIDQLAYHCTESRLWSKEITLNRNDFLTLKGATDTNLYYIEKGSVRIFIEGADEEHTIRFGYSHNFVTALDSFITGQPTDFYIQALKKTQVKVILQSAFQQFLEQDNHRLLWQKIMEQLIYQQLEREKDLLTSSPTERYQKVQQRSPQLFQEIPHKYIASYLRMTPETLSRLKKS